MQEADKEYLDLCTDNEGVSQPAKLTCCSCGDKWHSFRWLIGKLCCVGLCAFRNTQKFVMLPVIRFGRRHPIIGRPVEHCCERNRCLKLCGFCWCVGAIVITVVWILWMLIIFGIFYGMPLDNAELVKSIEALIERNCTFSKVCYFKDWTYFVGTKLGSSLTHEGAILEVVDANGKSQEFLQLEYGARGTYWQLSTAPQPDPRYGVTMLEKVGKIPCRYKCGTIASSQRDPRRLLWFLNKYRNQSYNVFHYNCVNFAHMVYEFHLPDTIKCFTTSEFQQHMYEVASLAR